jgi:MFS family permease
VQSAVTAAFLAVSAASVGLLAIAPSYGWALLAFFLFGLAYVIVITTGITVRQMLTPDHLQARVNTAGRMIAGGGLPVGALLTGLLAEVLPIRPSTARAGTTPATWPPWTDAATCGSRAGSRT